MLEALSSAKGRGKAGLSEEQLEQLNRAVAALEADVGGHSRRSNLGAEGAARSWVIATGDGDLMRML